LKRPLAGARPPLGDRGPTLPAKEGRSQAGRFANVREKKATGATYTPERLAAYVAENLVLAAQELWSRSEIHILEPSLGDGALLAALLTALEPRTSAALHVVACEMDKGVARRAGEQMKRRFPRATIEVVTGDFLALAGARGQHADLVITNPPYVRTQILGKEEARALSERFGLTGRVDLYQAFLLALIAALRSGGALAAIVSNRLLTTRGAGALRSVLTTQLDVCRLWDLGDTKLFNAAVLPAVLVGRRAEKGAEPARPPLGDRGPTLRPTLGDRGPTLRAPLPRFTSVYECPPSPSGREVSSIVDALDEQGVFCTPEGRSFELRQGTLSSAGADVWRLSSPDLDAWLATVAARTWRTLGALGKIRVGVKTTADRVFIRDDWGQDGEEEPELLRPLVTHEIARRYRALTPQKKILYPHLVVDGARSVADLAHYPRAARYLERHRAALEARSYLIEAGRKWYEIWVPQDPAQWDRPKLVFRDIAERATFWLDRTGAVVNGDCYWMTCRDESDDEHLWLAVAISNTRFIEAFYDTRFNNKLYAGRRRFMTQYVEQFPLPDPESAIARKLAALARGLHEEARSDESLRRIEAEMDRLTWRAFGVAPLEEEPPGIWDKKISVRPP